MSVSRTRSLLLCLLLLVFSAVQLAAAQSNRNTATKASSKRVARHASGAEIEARLLQIYRLIGQSNTRDALALAEMLVRDQPNFQLGQLVYADLLQAQTRPVAMLGSAPEALTRAAPGVLTDLRSESRARIQALQEPPPANSIPVNFLGLTSENQHAIAVDASRSRLYLFQNTGEGLRLLAHYYISVGKYGIEKQVEGDLRTPIGPYFINSKLFPHQLIDFYGTGALPINYPNPFDIKRGKTGSGIWLHGTPSEQYSRAPKASNGCVVLANADLHSILQTVNIRSTPVVIAPRLSWVKNGSARPEPWNSFTQTWQAWHSQMQAGNADAVLRYYGSDFLSNGKRLADFAAGLRQDVQPGRGRALIGKPSFLYWDEPGGGEIMVATYALARSNGKGSETKRQYWQRARPGAPWQVFFDATI